MDLSSEIVAQSLQMSAAQAAQSYSVAVTKAAMELQETSVDTLIEDLLPATAAIPKGEYIDVFA